MNANPVQAPLSLAGGILRAPSVKIESDQAVLRTDIQLDLNRFVWGGSGALDMVLPQHERNDVAPQVQFALSGSWSQPQIRFDYQPMVQFLTQRSLLREQLRVEAAQSLIIEKQRLKREADYYSARAESTEASAH